MGKRQICFAITGILVTSFLQGCASWLPSDVVEPKDVTVSEALKDIGKGFANLETELRGKVLGVYPCKVSVSLDVKASAKDAGKLVVDLSTRQRVVEGINNPLNPAAKANIERSGEASAERGNVVSIEMYNPACLPNNTLGYEKPENITDAMNGMAITKEQADNILNLQNILKEPPSE